MPRAGGTDFYDRTALWWGTSGITDRDRARALLVNESAGRSCRVLELGAGFGGAAAATADLGHRVIAVERSAQRAALARRHEWKSRSGELEIIEADFDSVVLEGPFDVVAYWSGFGVGNDASQASLLTRVRGWLAPAGI